MSREIPDASRGLDAETWSQHSTRARPAERLLVPGLTILCHPDLTRIGERVALAGLVSGRGLSLSRLEPELSPPGSPRRRPLADPYLSRGPIVRLEPGPSAGELVVEPGTSKTAVLVDGEPLTEKRRLSPAELERGVAMLLARRVALLLHLLDPVGAGDLPHYGLVGDSPAVQRLRREIARAAPLATPVLLTGETGVGKELVAQAIHRAGPRRRQPFLTINMGGVPATLAASELFGAARGAFTGADRERTGYFRRAHGGTLFLDEIGETPPEVQPLLLRALESGEIQPVGGVEPQRVDVRVLAATDADLPSAVAAGRFRAPLLYRLESYEIPVPPLAERRDDVGRLLLHFLRQELAALGEERRLAPREPGERPWLPAELVARLAAHDWPGNVRQLKNVARRLVVVGREQAEIPVAAAEPLLTENLGRPSQRRAAAAEDGAGEPVPPRRYRPIEEVSEEELRRALAASRFSFERAAARLGVARASLYDRVAQSPGIRKASDLAREEIESVLERQGGIAAAAAALEVSQRALKRRMTQLGLPWRPGS